MRILDVQVVGEELAVKWDDGMESFIRLDRLRRCCPCAGCQGERDVLGNLYKGPEVPLTVQSFQLTRILFVGGYALQPIWADGHTTGLYSFEYLRNLGREAQAP